MAKLVMRLVDVGGTSDGFSLYYAGIFIGSDVPGGGLQFTEGGAERLGTDTIPWDASTSDIDKAIRTAAENYAAALNQGWTVDKNEIFVEQFTKV